MPLTLFPYFGGKYFMANKLYPLFPEHRVYAEPFGGSGVVLLSKKESQIEIFNDISKDITTLFKVVRNHPESFYREMDKCLVSRDEFNRLVKPTRICSLISSGHTGSCISRKCPLRELTGIIPASGRVPAGG